MTQNVKLHCKSEGSSYQYTETIQKTGACVNFSVPCIEVYLVKQGLFWTWVCSILNNLCQTIDHRVQKAKH